jgi:tetratricopeptide (TPR) repeat protein
MITGCSKKNDATKPVDDPIAAAVAKANAEPNYETFIELGLRYSEANRSLDALAAYEKAKVLNMTNAVSWNNICSEKNKMGLFGDAVASCNRAVELDPLMDLAKNNLEIAKKNLEDTKLLIADKLKLIATSATNNSQDLIDLGMMYYKVGEYKKSVDTWSNVKRSDSNFANAQNNVASSYIMIRNFKAAKMAINEALAIDPKNELYLNNLKWLEDEQSFKN